MNAAEGGGATVVALNRLFVRGLLALGAGSAAERDHACRLAAAGWSELRRDYPREAERLNGLLHSLTRSAHPGSHTKEKTDVQGTRRSQSHPDGAPPPDLQNLR